MPRATRMICPKCKGEEILDSDVDVSQYDPEDVEPLYTPEHPRPNYTPQVRKCPECRGDGWVDIEDYL